MSWSDNHRRLVLSSRLGVIKNVEYSAKPKIWLKKSFTDTVLEYERNHYNCYSLFGPSGLLCLISTFVVCCLDCKIFLVSISKFQDHSFPMKLPAGFSNIWS